MIDYREYWARVHRYLDERREPLDDAQVVAFLDAHPEHLQAFAEQRADLEQVATLQPVVSNDASRAQRPWLYAAAAAVVFGLGWFAASGFSAGSGSGDVADSGTATTGESTHRPSRILSATLHEVEPTLRPAAFYTVHDPLVQTATITLEAYEQRSELR